MTQPDFTRPPIWEHEKHSSRLIAGEREFKGTRFLDLREWAGAGEIATRKGITIPLDAVPEFAQALTAYAATLIDGAIG